MNTLWIVVGVVGVAGLWLLPCALRAGSVLAVLDAGELGSRTGRVP